MNRFIISLNALFSTNKKEARIMIQNQVRAFLQLADEERAILQVVEEAIGLSREIRQNGRRFGNVL